MVQVGSRYACKLAKVVRRYRRTALTLVQASRPGAASATGPHNIGIQRRRRSASLAYASIVPAPLMPSVSGRTTSWSPA